MLESWVRNGYQLLIADFKSQDLDKLTSHYTFNARITDETGIYDGKESILNYWKSRIESGIDEITFHTQSVKGSYDKFFATERGTFDLMKEGESIHKGLYIAIWRHNADGWKIHNVTYISPNGN